MKSGGEGQDPKPSNNNTPEASNQNTPQNGPKEGTVISAQTTPRTSAPGTPLNTQSISHENAPNVTQSSPRTSVPGTPQSSPSSVPNVTPKVEISSADNDTLGLSKGNAENGAQNTNDSVSVGNGSPPQLILPSDANRRDSITQLPSTPGSLHMSYLGVLDHGDTQSIPLEELEEEQPNPFRLFTPESYERLIIKEEEDKQKALEKKNRPAEGRLVDGELKFDDEEEDGPPMERDPLFFEGNSLPDHLAEIFPPEYYTKPIEDIDQYIKAKVSNILL